MVRTCPRALLLAGGQERSSELFVKREEVLDALAVVVKGLRAVTKVNRAIERGVSLHERGRHGQRVVKIGQRRIGKFRPRVEHGLRGFLYVSALFGRWRFRPRKVVIDKLV